MKEKKERMDWRTWRMILAIVLIPSPIELAAMILAILAVMLVK